MDKSKEQIVYKGIKATETDFFEMQRQRSLAKQQGNEVDKDEFSAGVVSLGLEANALGLSLEDLTRLKNYSNVLEGDAPVIISKLESLVEGHADSLESEVSGELEEAKEESEIDKEEIKEESEIEPESSDVAEDDDFLG